MAEINKVTGNFDRSTNSGKSAIIEEVYSSPIGSQAGDPRPGVAFNALPASAVYFARNLSHKEPRKVLRKAVSAIGHVPEEIQQKAKLDESTIRDMVNHGLQDFSEYDYVIDPVDKVFYADGKPYAVRCSREKGHAGEWTPIPESVWDLQLGNFNRMHGIATIDPMTNKPRAVDPFDKADEQTKLSGRFAGRGVAFEEGTDRGEWAYIEMRREEIVSEPVAVDREKIHAGIRIEI